MVPEMSVVLSHLTWLSPRKDFSKYILTTNFVESSPQVVISVVFYCVPFTSCIWENMDTVN